MRGTWIQPLSATCTTKATCMNIVDVFGSLPSTQLNRFIYYKISALHAYTVFSYLPVIITSYVIYSVGDCNKKATVSS